MASAGKSLQAPGPTPQRFFEAVTSYQKTEALKAAIALDVFTAIADGASTASQIARRAQASERGVRILCDYLTVAGFLTKHDSTYGLAPDSAVFLNRHSPAYLGSMANFLASDEARHPFHELAAAVKKGGTAIEDHGVIVPDNPLWVLFARSMAPLMRMSAEQMAKAMGAESAGKWKVLDIAAGHGTFGITVARLNPQVEIYALDWPNVLEVAKENAGKAGVASRFHTIPGSAFDVAFGNDFDIVLIPNFLHHFDPRTNEKLLKKVWAALKPGGRAVTLEFIPNEDRVSPPIAASFSLTMLAGTSGGDAYTFAEFEKMFGNAGFTRSELHELPGSPQRVIVSFK